VGIGQLEPSAGTGDSGPAFELRGAKIYLPTSAGKRYVGKRHVRTSTSPARRWFHRTRLQGRVPQKSACSHSTAVKNHKIDVERNEKDELSGKEAGRSRGEFSDRASYSSWSR